MAIKEEWRSILGYDGLYEASSEGRIRSVERIVVNKRGHARSWPSKVLAVRPSSQAGRREVKLSRSGRAKTLLVAPLVAGAFLGPRPRRLDVCHNNGVHTDDRIENLRYDTRSENIRDSWKHGRTHRRIAA